MKVERRETETPVATPRKRRTPIPHGEVVIIAAQADVCTASVIRRLRALAEGRAGVDVIRGRSGERLERVLVARGLSPWPEGGPR